MFLKICAVTIPLMLMTCGCSGESQLSQDTVDDQLIVDDQSNELTIDPTIEYLNRNAARDEVTVTQSGLQYEVLTFGTGSRPSADSVVTVHYLGRLTDGTVFDSSIARGQAATFSLTRVIEGWTEGLQLMHVGSHFQFVIPAHLAYGDRSVGEFIGPGETLVFDVELLEINSN